MFFGVGECGSDGETDGRGREEAEASSETGSSHHACNLGLRADWKFWCLTWI